MEETVTEGASIGVLLCQLLFGSAECPDGQRPDMPPVDHCAGPTSRYELVIGGEGTNFDQSAVSVLEDRLDVPEACDLAIDLRTRGEIVIEIETAGDPMTLVAPMLRPGALTLHRVDDEHYAGQTLPAGLVELTSLDGLDVYVVDESPLLYGASVSSAEPTFTEFGDIAISISFTDKAAERFGEITSQMVGHRLAMVIDGQVLFAPTIRTPILGGQAIISGNYTAAEATETAALLASGPLPDGLSILSIEALPLAE